MGRSLPGTGTSCASERASAAGGCGPRDLKGRKACPDYLIVRFCIKFSLCQAGATPGVGLQLRDACYGPAGSGHKIKRTFFIYAIRKNRRFSCPSRFAASGGGRKADTLRHLTVRFNSHFRASGRAAASGQRRPVTRIRSSFLRRLRPHAKNPTVSLGLLPCQPRTCKTHGTPISTPEYTVQDENCSDKFHPKDRFCSYRTTYTGHNKYWP